MKICAICNNSFDNKSFVVKEMMFGFRDEFSYFQCSECGCLQLAEIPEDMNKYYPSKYYSYYEKRKKTFRNRIKDYLLPSSMKFRMGISSSILYWISNFRYRTTFSWINKEFGKYQNSSVLDVGCGSGSLISYFSKCGFTKLTGIDPYLSKTFLGTDFSLLKNDLMEMETTFKLIMFHHSFEHMSNQHEVFNQLSKLLEDDGLLLIRIPLVDSYAWRTYGTSWFALDAPRHLFLHTAKSINYLVQEYGFYIDKVLYDSTDQQFYYSDGYQRNIALCENSDNFSTKEIKDFQAHAKNLNRLKDGDQACFYIRKNKLFDTTTI